MELLIIPHTDEGPVQGATLQEAVGFRFPIPDAHGQRLEFEIKGKVLIEGTGQGVKFDLIGPDGADLEASGFLNNGTPVDIDDFGVAVGANVGAGSRHYKIEGVIHVGFTPGWVILRFAQNTAGSGGVTLQAHKAAIWAKEETGGWA